MEGSRVWTKANRGLLMRDLRGGKEGDRGHHAQQSSDSIQVDGIPYNLDRSHDTFGVNQACKTQQEGGRRNNTEVWKMKKKLSKCICHGHL